MYLLAVLGLSYHMWNVVPCPGIKPNLPHWEHEVLAREVPLTVLLSVRFLYVVKAYFVCLLAYFE